MVGMLGEELLDLGAVGIDLETWRGGMAQMPSLGGSIGQWFYKTAAGIRPDPSGPGFKRIIIKPSIMGDLVWVRAHFDSPYGQIVSNWKTDAGKLMMDVTIPVNATATVWVPTQEAQRITESGNPAIHAEGVEYLGTENGAAAFKVSSGTHHFVSTFNRNYDTKQPNSP